MSELIIPDIEVWATDFFRNESDLIAEGILPVRPAGDLGNISTELPKPMDFPWFRLWVVPGGLIDSDGEGVIVQQLLQFDFYGADAVTLGRETSPDWTTASRLARVVFTIARLMPKERIIAPDGDDGYAFGWAPTAVPHRIPEPETGWAHMSFSALLTLSGEE